MKQAIDIELFKENPHLFFSQLPKKTEKKIVEFLRFIVFKYDLKNLHPNKKMKKTNVVSLLV